MLVAIETQRATTIGCRGHLITCVPSLEVFLRQWTTGQSSLGSMAMSLAGVHVLSSCQRALLWMGAFIRAPSAAEPKVDISSQRINYTHKSSVPHRLKLFRWQQKVALELRRPAGWLCCLHAFWRGRERRVSARGKNLFHGAGNRLHGYTYNGNIYI